MILIINAGKKIKETTYFDSEAAIEGKMFFSVNAGCVRMLLPDNMASILPEIRTGKKVVISRGPWPDMDREDAFEIMFEDYSDTPFCVNVGLDQWDLVPKKESVGTKWEFAVWTRQGCAFHKKCYYRLVESLPCRNRWDKS